MKKIALLNFENREALFNDLCFKIGKSLNGDCSFVNSGETADVCFLYDSKDSPGKILKLMKINHHSNIVVLTEDGNTDRAQQCIQYGAIDYRNIPCPDDVFKIYLTKTEFRQNLSIMANKAQSKNSGSFVTENPKTKRILDMASLLAKSDASILVTGESGTGKERMSKFIHGCSDRKNIIAINCSSIPEGVFESELFGHEKGSFTGADKLKIGKFEQASGGTLLLDEISEMPIHLQAKLLRAIQEGEVDRIGGKSPVKVDVRIIATSNKNIKKAIADGTFREDLYYRLNVVEIDIPPLRDRKEDIIPLANHFCLFFAKKYDRPEILFTSCAKDILLNYYWPGNVREMENIVHKNFLLSTGKNEINEDFLELNTEHTKNQLDNIKEQFGMTIKDMERVMIKDALLKLKGDKNETAKLLGISIRTLRNKLNEYNGNK